MSTKQSQDSSKSDPLTGFPPSDAFESSPPPNVNLLYSRWVPEFRFSRRLPPATVWSRQSVKWPRAAQNIDPSGRLRRERLTLRQLLKTSQSAFQAWSFAAFNSTSALLQLFTDIKIQHIYNCDEFLEMSLIFPAHVDDLVCIRVCLKMLQNKVTAFSASVLLCIMALNIYI